MKQVGLLAGLLVVLAGTGVLAQSPSPQATPLYAPDDLASAVPSRVGSLELFVRVRSGDAALGSDPDDRTYWLDFLTTQGKGPADLVVAYGVSTESASDPGLGVWAVRVEGLAAELLTDPVLATSGTGLSGSPAGGHADWRDLEGRRVLLLTHDDAADWRAYYPHGEVLFVVYGDDRVVAGDVIRELAPDETSAPSPPAEGARPMYAPEDLAVALPSRVGEYEVRVATGVLPPTYQEVYRDMLRPFGQSPEDIRGADGMGYPAGDEDALDRDGSSFDLWAMRVEGIPADALVVPWVYGAFNASESFDEALWQMGWRDIDGREVYAATPIPELMEDAVSRLGANPEAGWYVFAKGEVMFIVRLPLTHPSGSPALSEILAELP